MAREPLVNDFSWSKSRAENFDKCLRLYFLIYYGAWNGWEASAPEQARTIYRLKKLANRWTWPAKVVHDSVKEAMRAAAGGLKVDGARVLAESRAIMRADWQHSRNDKLRGTKRRADFTGLVEHEMGVATDDMGRDAWALVEANMKAFFAGTHLARAAALGRAALLELDDPKLEGFRHFGVKVHAAPDLALKLPDQVIEIDDWKTGRMNDADDDQLAGYVRYVEARGFTGYTFTGKLVYLTEGRTREVPLTPEVLAKWDAKFIASTTAMQAMLTDFPAGNTPKPIEAFPKTDDLRKCSTCTFRGFCGRADAKAA